MTFPGIEYRRHLTNIKFVLLGDEREKNFCKIFTQEYFGWVYNPPMIKVKRNAAQLSFVISCSQRTAPETTF